MEFLRPLLKWSDIFDGNLDLTAASVVSLHIGKDILRHGDLH